MRHVGAGLVPARARNHKGCPYHLGGADQSAVQSAEFFLSYVEGAVTTHP
jgi:hypothetical protein